jgi:hypothetical protein
MANTPIDAWLPAALATTDVGTAFVIHPAEESEAALQQIKAELLAGGCLCSIDTPDLLVFEYVGLASGDQRDAAQAQAQAQAQALPLSQPVGCVHGACTLLLLLTSIQLVHWVSGDLTELTDSVCMAMIS